MQHLLPPDVVQDARGLYDHGLATQTQLAHRLQLSVKTVAQIVNRLSYRGVREIPDWLQGVRRAKREEVLGIPVRSAEVVRMVRDAYPASNGHLGIVQAYMQQQGYALTDAEITAIVQKRAYPEGV